MNTPDSPILYTDILNNGTNIQSSYVHNIDNITNIGNIHPNLRITFFSRKDKDLIRTLKTDAINLCRGAIATNYIKKSFDKFDNGILLNDYDIGRRHGFIIWKETHTQKDKPNGDSLEYKTLFIQLICTRKAEMKSGPLLMFEVEKYATNNNINYINLEPAEYSLVPYYEAYGYTITFQQQHELIMGKMIKPVVLKRTRQTRKRIRTSTFQHPSSPYLVSPDVPMPPDCQDCR